MAGMVGVKNKGGGGGGGGKGGGGGGGKGGGGANGAKGGGGNGGLVQAQGAAPTGVTYTWVCNAANPRQIIVTFSVPVVWNQGVPPWSILNPPAPPNIANSATVNTLTQVTITFGANVNCTTGVLSIPQNDPTFKGLQGQFVQSGKQTSGPQK